jgi:hypothetical protein
VLDRRQFLCTTLVLAAISACYTGGHVDPQPTSSIAANAPASSAPTRDALPCDVATLLVESCGACHGEPPSHGAKSRLATEADLAASSIRDPSKTVADDCLDRMKSEARPMPPAAALTAERIAVFERWVAAGMPTGTCDAPPPPPAPPPDVPTICTSQRHWTRGDHGSASMHPGVACIDCHTKEDEGPIYRIAGTVYPTVHEPDDCYGTGGSVTVEITDANGKRYSLPVNEAGNFFSKTRIATPYTAKVVAGGKTREMVAPQTNGDCNTCHTEQGSSDALGRIWTP